MSSQADHISSKQDSVAHTPLWRRQQFWRIALPAVAVISILVAGLVVLDSTVGSNGIVESQTGWGVTYPVPKPPKTVKMELAAQLVATKFVNTAVARKDLETAYLISGPHVREGMTLKQFLTGNIPVVPYKITSKTAAHMKIDKSYAHRAQLELYLVTPGSEGRDFFVDLIKRGNKWFVDGWVPRGTPPIPVTQ